MRSVTAFLALVLATVLQAQQTPRLDPALVAPLKWRSIGPVNTGGRIDDFAVARVPGAPDAIYVATASGGNFKSANGGNTWGDTGAANASVYLVIDPANPETLYAGMSDGHVFKSTDGARIPSKAKA